MVIYSSLFLKYWKLLLIYWLNTVGYSRPICASELLLAAFCQFRKLLWLPPISAARLFFDWFSDLWTIICSLGHKIVEKKTRLCWWGGDWRRTSNSPSFLFWRIPTMLRYTSQQTPWMFLPTCRFSGCWQGWATLGNGPDCFSKKSHNIHRQKLFTCC